MNFSDIYIAVEITKQNDNGFEIDYTVAFSAQEGIILPANSDLILYWIMGLPKVVTLINPENRC